MDLAEHLKKARLKAIGECMRRPKAHYQKMQALGCEKKRAQRILRAKTLLGGTLQH